MITPVVHEISNQEAHELRKAWQRAAQAAAVKQSEAERSSSR
jgi:hypothetical protein